MGHHNHNDFYKDKKGGHFFNGFFWGAVLGGGLAYLLSTKKGRDLLRELVQDGIDMLDDATMPEDAGVVSEPEVYEEVEQVSAETPKTSTENTKKESSRKRFFRRVVKK